MNEFLENTISYMKENKRSICLFVRDCHDIFKEVKYKDLIIMLTVRLRLEYGDQYHIPRPILYDDDSVMVEMNPK